MSQPTEADVLTVLNMVAKNDPEVLSLETRELAQKIVDTMAGICPEGARAAKTPCPVCRCKWIRGGRCPNCGMSSYGGEWPGER